jgi:hypothetical protein
MALPHAGNSRAGFYSLIRRDRPKVNYHLRQIVVHIWVPGFGQAYITFIIDCIGGCSGEVEGARDG